MTSTGLILSGVSTDAAWIKWPRKTPPTLGEELDCGELGKATVIEAKFAIEGLAGKDGVIVGTINRQIARVSFLVEGKLNEGSICPQRSRKPVTASS